MVQAAALAVFNQFGRLARRKRRRTTRFMPRRSSGSHHQKKAAIPKETALGHPLTNSKFSELTLEERSDFSKEKKLSLSCLRSAIIGGDCERSKR